MEKVRTFGENFERWEFKTWGSPALYEDLTRTAQ